MLSLLLSTLLLIDDEAILASTEYSQLISTVINSSQSLLGSSSNKSDPNLHTLLMLTSFLLRRAKLSWSSNPELWDLVSGQLARREKDFCKQGSAKSKGALSELIMFYINGSRISLNLPRDSEQQ